MGEAGAEGGGTTSPDVACIGGHWSLGGSDGIIISGGDKMMGKIRPQIMVAMIAALIFSLFAAWIGYLLDATEILTSIISGLFGFLAGTSMRILQNDENEKND